MKKNTLRVLGVLTLPIIMVLGFWVYGAFIKAGPGDWEDEDLIEWANNSTTAIENTVLVGAPETVDILGVQWKRQRATATIRGATIREGELFLAQNAEAGLALNVFQWSPGKKVAIVAIHGPRCGGQHDFRGILNGYLKLTVEGFSSHETESSIKDQIRTICGLFETGKTQDFGAPCDTMFEEIMKLGDKACQNL